MTSSNSMKNYEFINAFAGLCEDLKNWPNDLYKMGYRIVAVEPSFKNSTRGIVNPELVIASDDKNHSILIESKSGTLDGNQHDRYRDVSAEDLAQGGNLPISKKETHIFDISYLCDDSNETSVKKALAEKQSSFPLVNMNHKFEEATWIKKKSGDFNETDVDKLFTKGIKIPHNYPPVSLIPILSDPDFPDYLVAKMLLPQVVKFMVEGRRIFEVPTLLSEAIPYHLWDCFDKKEKDKIINKVTRILSMVSRDALKPYIRRVGIEEGGEVRGAVSRFKVVNELYKLSASERTNTLKKLKTISELVVNDLKEGKKSDYQTSMEDIVEKVVEENPLLEEADEEDP